MSSEEVVEEHSEFGEWSLGENEPYETTDGTQHFNEARYVMFGYVIGINWNKINISCEQTMHNCTDSYYLVIIITHEILISTSC